MCGAAASLDKCTGFTARRKTCFHFIPERCWHLQVGALKQRLAGVLQLAANKQQLSRDGVGFLRNELSLAHYNVGPSTQLTLSTRSRGRR